MPDITRLATPPIGALMAIPANDDDPQLRLPLPQPHELIDIQSLMEEPTPLLSGFEDLIPRTGA